MKNHKRYWIFAGEKYYAGGGVNDLVDKSDNLKEAERKAFQLMGDKRVKLILREDYAKNMDISIEWVQIYDTEEDRIVFEEGDIYNGNRFVSR